MKLNIVAGLVLGCGLLSAAPPPCVTGTLASYIALGAQGCALDGDVFANFTYSATSSGGAPTITADQITVTPLIAVPTTAVLFFAAPWKVAAGQTQDSKIQYTIVPPPTSGATTTPPSSQLGLTLGSARVGGIIGAVAVNETTNVGNLSVFERCVDVCQIETSDTLNFVPVSVVLVSDQVSLSGGNGGASLTDFSASLNRCILCV
jgi:hypothetical protein